MITIGRRYALDVVKAMDFGLYLDAGELGQVLLPRKHAPHTLKVGDRVGVFLYLDSEDRPVATTQIPKAGVGDFAYLRVVAVSSVGAFLDWGLDKDVLVPFAEQHRPLEVGHSYLVYLYIDPRDGRIVASSKVDRFVEETGTDAYQPHQAVDLIIANSTPLGFKAIINHRHWGVLYKEEVFQRLSFGQGIPGFIKQVRPDGRIDLTLQGGQQSRDRNADLIEARLRRGGGFLAVHDKSDPQEIATLFGMSKGAFKQAIGNLQKQGVLVIGKDGIRLTE